MDRRILSLAVLALAGTALSGCAAAAIPAIAGSAMIGTQIDGKDASPAARRAAPPIAAATPPPVVPSSPPAASMPTASTPPPAAAPASASTPVATAAAAPPPPSPQPSVPVASPSAPLVTSPAATGITAAVPQPAAPSAPGGAQAGFSQFVRYGRGIAAASAGATGPLSAMLADPVALDGQRKRCAAREQPVVVIDLDPDGGLFEPPADPERIPGVALGLAVLREAGVKIAWISDLPVAEIGAVRSALELAGLDPRGEDIVSLRRDPEDRKQLRKESLAASSCIIAIAGDTKADFDERFQYLKNPEAGKALEAAIGDGWFLIEPIFPVANNRISLP
jgi:hypothetical protein